MKRILCALFLIIFSTISYSQKKLCSDFKTGTFEYTNAKYSEWKVVRTDSTQTENNYKNGIELKAKNIWNSACGYVLTYEKTPNSDLKNFIGKKMFVKIFEIENKKFKYHSKLDDM